MIAESSDHITKRGCTESWRDLHELACATLGLLHLLALGYALGEGGIRRLAGECGAAPDAFPCSISVQ